LTNMSAPLAVAGPALVVGGQAHARLEGGTFLARPLGRNVSIELRGDAGIKLYNGSSWVFQVVNASVFDIEAPGAFALLATDAQIRLSRAPLATAERGTGLEDLFAELRALTPPQDADRRADLAEVFGPFQLVPALLDGTLAARSNLTLNGGARDGFTLVRAPDARLGLENASWVGQGNATLLVAGDALGPDPGSETGAPIVVPLVLAAAAIAARAFTKREATPWRKRRLLALARVGGLLVLVLLAAWTLAPLLGFHPLFDLRALSTRSRAQVLTLTAALGLVAWLGVGLSLESLARSAFAWRKRKAARWIPAAVGFVGAALFLWLASAGLTSLVARFVRL